MKAILLAGGSGTRLRPTTLDLNKHLLNVYNKPMIFYSLSVLMLAKIRNIILISDKNNLPCFKKFFGTGRDLGIKIKYLCQNKPNGIPEAFLIAKKEIQNSSTCLMLGDNFFFGQGMQELLLKGKNSQKGAFFYAYNVSHPENFAVVSRKNKKIELIEKPKNPKTNLAVPGIYFFDKNVVKHTRKLKKSKRNELEIVDLINEYIKVDNADYLEIGRGISWLDMGTFDDLNHCSNFVMTIENRQNYLIGSPEEIAFRNNWISKNQLNKISKKYNNSYGYYLRSL